MYLCVLQCGHMPCGPTGDRTLSGVRLIDATRLAPSLNPFQYFFLHLLHKHEIHGCYQTGEGCEVVPLQGFSFEEQVAEDDEYGECDYFLDDLELHEGERTSVFFESDAVGRDLKQILEEGYSPAEEDDSDEWEGFEPAELFHFEVAVPGKCHKQVGYDQKNDCDCDLHMCL